MDKDCMPENVEIPSVKICMADIFRPDFHCAEGLITEDDDGDF